jgi:hypothetical protein
VQTLTAATFSRLPKPDVSRRYRDQDPVGRVAALILERGLDYHVQHYPEYRTAIRASVYDRFLGARGTCWVRYEPHFRAQGGPSDGAQITEDVDTPHEELDYECVAVDYVHWKDFGHSVARTWEEVPRVWRKVYMNRAMLEERFGEKAKQIPLDADPRQSSPDKAYGSQDARLCATVFEGWDKSKKCAVWFNKSVKDFLDRKEYGDEGYVNFEDGFPCPRPLYGTLTNDSLVPVPDFVIYQDQANELDNLADKIDGLVKALKVCGGYDASVPELGRIFTEADNGTLIPVKNWAAFAEKNGLAGALSLVDLKPIAEALLSAYEAFKQVKEQIYELTGISDIVRGQTSASETATAQEIKGQFASLRLKTYQDGVAYYASDVLSLMAQVICRKFSPETIAKIAGADQLTPQDQQAVPKAMELLVGPERLQNPDAEEGPNPVREFRIEVASDSMVYLDEQAEQQARVEFLGAVGSYLKEVAGAMAGMPQPILAVLIPLLMDMLKFGVTGYRVGKQIEGAFDEAAEKLKQLAMQPPAPPQPPEAVQVAQIKGQIDEQNSQREDARETKRMQQELQFNQAKHDQDMQFKEREMQFKEQQHAQQMDQNERQFNAQLETDSVLKNAKQSADLELENKRIDAQAQPKVNIDGKEQIGAVAEELKGMGALQGETMTQAMTQLGQGMAAMAQILAEFKELAAQLGKRTAMQHIRDPKTNRITHSVPVESA